MEARLAFLEFYLQDGEFCRGLTRVGRQHQDDLTRLVETLMEQQEPWRAYPVARARRDGRSLRPFRDLMGPYVENFICAYMGMPGMEGYHNDLQNLRKDWGIVGRDPSSDFSFQGVFHGVIFNKVLDLWALTDPVLRDTVGLDEPPLDSYEEAVAALEEGITFWCLPETESVDVSTLHVVRLGSKSAARGMASKIGERYRRPRRRRAESLIWLYQRLALKRLPGEIAEDWEVSPDTVAHLTNRDARLVGLQIPRGWPKGRPKGRTGRIVRK